MINLRWRHDFPPSVIGRETALALASCDPRAVTGLCVYSTTYLREIGREIRTLDGRHVLGDWKPAIA
jgi:hypothetical protein